ncbi:hypothetical protein D3C81_2240720 [compost metagenome]
MDGSNPFILQAVCQLLANQGDIRLGILGQIGVLGGQSQLRYPRFPVVGVVDQHHLVPVC